MSSQLTIQIVGWNSASTLPAAVAALQAISAELVTIRYIDNASTDSSVEIVRQALPHADIIVLSNNQGFAGAHNIAFKKCITPFVLTHDPDVVLNWSGVQKLLEVFADPKVGAVQGKLYRAEPVQPVTFDSTGITLNKTFNGRERGANEIEHQQYEQAVTIDAVTGACGLYRVVAVQAVGPTFFETDFVAYKEDVDVGWRLRRGGWLNTYVPIIMGTHKRTLGRRGTIPWWLNPGTAMVRLRSPRSRYSFRNWIWMIAKNASTWQIFTHSPFIIGRLVVWAGLSLLYPPFFKVWVETLSGLPKMRAKR